MTQKFKPILFSTDMVNAILEGRKTQTRRTKGLEKLTNHYFQSLVLHATGRYTFVENGNYSPSNEDVIEVKCPYEIGDILWVRESFYAASNYNHWNPRLLINCNVEIFYKADIQNSSIKQPLHRGKKRPSIFMPKEAARIFLKVTDVRAERLHDISESDAIVEGVYKHNNKKFVVYEDYNDDFNGFATAKLSFKSLWQKINGVQSWSSNPFVWVIEFEKIDKPQNFI